MDVHFPECDRVGEAVRRRFAFEELFAVQLNVAWRRSRYHEQSGRVLGEDVSLLKQFHAAFPSI